MGEAVLLVAGNDILGTAGGHPSYVRAHGWAARRAGFEPHVLTLSQCGGAVEAGFGVVHRVRVRLGVERWPVLRHRKNQLVWRYATLARAAAALVLERPDIRVIHSFGVFGAVGVMARDRLRRHGVHVTPVLSSYDTATREVAAKLGGVSRAHGRMREVGYRLELAWIRGVVARYERRGYLESQMVLVNYESVRRHLSAVYGIGDRIRTLPYSSDAAFRDPADPASIPPGDLPPGDAPLVVTVSRHDPRKGVDVLLHALAALRRTGQRFRACLVGGGALLLAHRRLAAQLGLGDVVRIPGQVSDPCPYLARADVFVLPSLEEGSGSLSLLEALQAGVAAVASDVDGIPEDVSHEESALLVPPGDPAALAGAIERLLRDPRLRGDLARQGRRAFERRFSPDVFATALAGMYGSAGETR